MQLSDDIEKWREGCLEDIFSLCEAELRFSSDFTFKYIGTRLVVCGIVYLVYTTVR